MAKMSPASMRSRESSNTSGTHLSPWMEPFTRLWPGQVADRHDYASVSRAAATGVRAAVDRHLVRVDHLLDHAAQLAQVRVHARRLDRRVGGVARGGDQRLELRVEREGERAVDDVA